MCMLYIQALGSVRTISTWTGETISGEECVWGKSRQHFNFLHTILKFFMLFWSKVLVFFKWEGHQEAWGGWESTLKVMLTLYSSDFGSNGDVDLHCNHLSVLASEVSDRENCYNNCGHEANPQSKAAYLLGLAQLLVIIHVASGFSQYICLA